MAMSRLEVALRAWWQLVAEEAAGNLPSMKVVKARYDAVMANYSHQGYLDAIERWLEEGKPCPICGTETLCDVTWEDPGPGDVVLTLEWEGVGWSGAPLTTSAAPAGAP